MFSQDYYSLDRFDLCLCPLTASTPPPPSPAVDSETVRAVDIIRCTKAACLAPNMFHEVCNSPVLQRGAICLGG